MPRYGTPEPVSVTLDVGVTDIRITASERADTVVGSARVTKPTRRT
jgi:hypothetical protein